MKSFCSPKTSQKIMNGVFILSGVITLLILVTILGYILVKGLQVINFEFLFLSPIDAGREGGIFPMIIFKNPLECSTLSFKREIISSGCISCSTSFCADNTKYFSTPKVVYMSNVWILTPCHFPDA